MCSALHRAVWRNDFHQLSEHLALIHETEPESGWTPLHTALYYGHLRIAAQLIQSGSRLDAVDVQNRTPLDLVSKERPVEKAPRTDVFSWGSGVNFQLGTGNTDFQRSPRRIEQLTGARVATLSASKFHSMALTQEGELYTWGWGLGGRLGHGDTTLHTQNGAQLFPRCVAGLTGHRVISIAAAKHHSVAVTASGEVYSWGLNRDGRLGHATTVSKCVTPKRIAALKGIQALHAAAANKHSAIVTEAGEVYTWGSNVHGQLGYGTSDSASNPTPRCVEALKVKSISQLALSKRHTLALTRDGEVYSWGYKGVAPKRVVLAGGREKEAFNASGQPIQFHRGVSKLKKPIGVMVAAGVEHSCCLTATGVVLSWRSASPVGSVQEVGGKLAGKKAISLSAGKSAVAAVVGDGQVYAWDATREMGTPLPQLVSGMHQAAAVAVGEKHSLVLQKWAAPVEMPLHEESLSTAASGSVATSFSSPLSGSVEWADLEDEGNAFKCLTSSKGNTGATGVCPSLQLICEKTVVENVLDPRTAIQLYQYADIVGAAYLKSHALHLIVQNLALVIHEAHDCFGLLSDAQLKELEVLYQKQILQMSQNEITDWWDASNQADPEMALTSRRPSYRYSTGSVPTSPVVHSSTPEKAPTPAAPAGNRFLPTQKSILKIQQTVQKKLQQIKILFQKEAQGEALDRWQRAKMARQGIYQRALEAIHRGATYDEVQELLSETPEIQKPSLEAAQKLRVPTKLQPKCEIAPNLRPVKPAAPRCREIGPLPRFLEPSQKPLTGAAGTKSQDPTPSELPIREKKWVKMAFETQPKSQGTVVIRAQPSKETRKMSLGDFMAVSDPPVSAKESTPAWGGIRFSREKSFESIQAEQRRSRPGMRSHDGLKPLVERRRTVSRWQLHSDVQIQSIHSIQIEEEAVQQLEALYKGATVRVKPGTARETKKASATKR